MAATRMVAWKIHFYLIHLHIMGTIGYEDPQGGVKIVEILLGMMEHSLDIYGPKKEMRPRI